MKKIMIVDDSAAVRHILRTFLVGEGYEVVEADSGGAGVACAQAQAFDLIISDVNMPGMTGLEMIAAVRQLPSHVATPIFVMSTQASGEMTARGKEAGATAWLTKPFRPEALRNAIAQWVARSPPTVP